MESVLNACHAAAVVESTARGMGAATIAPIVVRTNLESKIHSCAA